jgi:hypothetical protein
MSTSATMKAVNDSDDLSDPPGADGSATRRPRAGELRCRCQIVNGKIHFVWYATGAGRLRSL